MKIVRSAVKSPSGHNTQPWLFSLEKDGICIMPDFSRALPIADPENRELYISLGCAAETTVIAAKFYGYNPVLLIHPFGNPYGIKISLQKNATVEQPELFPYIAIRQTTRNLYLDKPVPENDLYSLKQTVKESGVALRLFSGQNGLGRFSPFIAEANTLQMNNRAFKNELIQWMRFGEKEAMKKGDGLYAACSGMPSMGEILGSFVLNNFVTAKSENIRLLKQLEKSTVLALFTTQSNNIEHWIKTGMAFQRFALMASKLGLHHSFLNSPCQIPQAGDKMINDLNLMGEVPQLLIRVGYSKAMPYSLRRNIFQFINR